VAKKIVQNGYPPRKDDPRIVKQYGALEAIATSSGQNDSGLFELNFRDERYLPFEFSGAVSRFRLELPPENNYFDIKTVTDVVLHLNYTAREGGDGLRAAASQVARSYLPDEGLRLLDVRVEFPDAWHRFSSLPATAPRELELTLTRDFFPFLPGQPALRVRRLEILFEADGACQEPPAAHLLELELPELRDCSHEDACDGPTRLVQALASAEWPGLYDGVAYVSLGPITKNEHAPTVTFRFPKGVGKVGQMFVVIGYEVAELSQKRTHS
jgi:hypothetical protein